MRIRKPARRPILSNAGTHLSRICSCPICLRQRGPQLAAVAATIR
jgi:hypothetical protein